MLKLKRIAMAILVVGVGSSSASFANVITPNIAPWSFGVNALYLQPSFGGNGLGYSTYGNYSGNDEFGNFVGVNGASNTIYDINPKWGWGFEVQGAYRFNAKNEVGIQWYHLNNRTNGYLPQGSLFAGNYDGLYAGRLQIGQRWDAVNLDVSHDILLDEQKTVRAFAGISFASINNQFKNHPLLHPSSPPIFNTVETLSYNGFGPRVGGDFGYTLGHGFGLYANAASSVLVGSNSQKVSGFQDLTTIPGYGAQLFSATNFSQTNNGIIVVELESKLGVKYDYQLAHGNLTLDIGYLWMSYLNGITSFNEVGVIDTAGVGTASLGAVNTTANFNLNGLYFGLKWSGNI